MPRNPVETAEDREPSFTTKQGEYLTFIWTYICLHGRSPAESDIRRYFQVAPPTVHQMIVNLERRGLIRRQPGVARSIEVLVDPKRLPAIRPRGS